MIHEQLDVHVALVGHTGKDESRGARGSNAHFADVDVMIQIGGDDLKRAEVIKANNQPERLLAAFTLEQVQLGEDEDGDPIATAIVSAEHRPCIKSPISKPRVSPKGEKHLSALRQALEGDQATVLPDGRRAVPTAAWRNACISAGLTPRLPWR
jgi:hypothetical protein